jgi:O-acetyl-ADP-ribose deacetylase (regulator of RNase III)
MGEGVNRQGIGRRGIGDAADNKDLHAPFDRTARSGRDRTLLLEELAAWVIADAGGLGVDAPTDDAARRRLVTRMLTVRPPRPIPPDVRSLLDEWFASDAAFRPVTSLDEVVASARSRMVSGRTRLHLWRGDITTLAVDAIVNAANSALLGCFRPGHACIDNAIHSAAGPRLREDCHRIIEHQGHPEPTGTAKITRAYYLPSRFVLHTVGPIVPDGRPTGEQQAQLADCYESCLNVAADLGLRSIAFCAISTGVFVYPKDEAACIAVDTVRAWSARHTGTVEDVVFDVFSEADEASYIGPGRFA